MKTRVLIRNFLYFRTLKLQKLKKLKLNNRKNCMNWYLGIKRSANNSRTATGDYIYNLLVSLFK